MRIRSLAAAALAAALALAASTAGAVFTPETDPAVPAEKAAKALQSVAIANGGFEAEANGAPGVPEGWIVMQHAGDTAYRVALDTETPRSGKRSVRLESIRPEAFGSIGQALPAEPWRGKTLRFSAWIRTKDVKGNAFGRGVGLYLNSLRGGGPLLYAQMQQNAVAGTTEWTRYEVKLKVPPEADHLEIGLIMYGEGTAWLDDAALDVVAVR
jgi:hypothetical protein